MTGQRGDEPGPYSGLFGSVPDSYGYRETAAPKQVTVAAVISAGLGAMCLLLAGLALTSAGAQISEVLTGSRGNTPVAVAAALVCAVVYLVPAIYVRKRHAWARYLLIGVAAMGIAGGLMALPASLLGLAIHVTLLILMFQRPTKLWFHHR
jgi:MFS family permease